jgi:NADH-quinone oxidoreductase subunit H
MVTAPIWIAATEGATTVWKTHTVSQRAAEALQQGGVLMPIVYLGAALIAILTLLTLLALALIYAERKIAGHFQCRLGPMRVGPHGIFQTLADTIKLVFKEDVVPDRADKLMHTLAPFLALAASVLVLAILPFSPVLHIFDLNIGVLYVTAIGGFGVMGVLLAGWSSNNKWSMVGAMRSGAQIISYEVSATLALLVVVMFSGAMSLGGIIESQDAGWWIWRAHGVGLVAFMIYIVASTAELNRTPFDIPEGESELTAGFHTEYSGLRFSFFFLAEFINMFIASALTAALFLGGWMPFHVQGWLPLNQAMDLIPPVLWFFGKTACVVFLIMWFRWTFPRLRVDQLMHLEWKILLPIGFLNLAAASVLVVTRWYFFPV